MSKQYGYITEPAIVKEMNSDGMGEIDVPVDKTIISELSDGDKDPMFVTIEVINEGVSRNGRAYDKHVIESLAEQINENKPDGFYGHLADDERHTKFPEPQTIWLGAKVLEVGGKTRLFAKGYILPEAKTLRSYLKKAKVAGKNVAVSVYGLAKVVKDKVKNISIVQDMTLESIDWARPGAEGVLNMGLFSVTSEMAQDNKITEGEPMDRLEVLKSATFEEMQEANSTLLSEMVDSTVAEVESQYADVVAEMTAIKDELGDKPVSVIKEMTQKLREYELDTQLRDKVESTTARKVIKQLVVSEMANGTEVSESIDKVLNSETGKAIIKEMLEAAPKVAPMTEQPAVVARKWTKKG